ncbi:protein of unknown function DUF4378, partial [Dillenia turbinata]
MESKQYTPSVMARLMGLDASLPHMQPVHKPQRVLSENYMRRTACVGFPGKRSSYKSSSFRMNIEKQEFKDAFEVPNMGELQDFPVQMECDDAQDVLLSSGLDVRSSVAYLQHNSLLLQSDEVSGLFTSDVSPCSSDACSISERIPKHDNNLGRWSHVENNKTCFSPESMVLLKPRFGKAQYTTPFFSPTSSNNISASSNRKQKGCARNDNWKSSEVEVKGTPKEHASERWKRTKRFEEVGWASGGKNIGNMLAVPDQETPGFVLGKHCSIVHFPRRSHLILTSTADGSSRSTNRNGIPHGEWRSEEVFNWWPKTSRKKALDKKEHSLPRSSRFRRTFKSSPSQNNVEKKHTLDSKLAISRIPCLDKEHNDTTQEAQVIVGGPGDNLQEKHLSERMITSDILSEVKTDLETYDIGSSHITEQQHSAPVTCIFVETSTRSNEDGSAPTDYCKMDSEFLRSSEEVSHPSPVSTLQPPFDEETSSSSESFDGISIDINGTQKHIQLPESELMEEELDELGIIVSSDDETVEEAVDLFERSRLYFDASKVEESRDFSYLVDVLYESGFHDGSFNLRLGKTLSEFPVDSLVFEALEKKLGEHKSWVRSERRLLFDCINLGLVEITQPLIDTRVWMKPVTRRMISKWSREGIEEELWMLLESQKKEAKRDSSEKVMGEERQWLDLRDIIYDICMEVERMLIDELVGEVVRVESCSSYDGLVWIDPGQSSTLSHKGETPEGYQAKIKMESDLLESFCSRRF